MTKLRVGHIGWLSRDEAADYTTVAWCDIAADKLRAKAAAHPGITPYTDYRQMLREARLDAVVIATPNFVHAEQAIAFLEAGVHVFLEKPMGVTGAECDAILRAAERSGKTCVIDFEMRISPFAAKLSRLIAERELGDLRHIEFIHHRGCWLAEGNGLWRVRPEQSGGLYFMEPIHEVDIFRLFAGEVLAVQSVAAPTVLPQYRFQDNVCSHFFFESGVLGTILTTHTLSAFTKEASQWARLGHDMNMIFTFTEGAVAVDFIGAKLLYNRFEEYPAGSGAKRVVHDRIEDYSAGGWHGFFHDITALRLAFLRRLAAGQPPVQSIRDAWRTHRVCLAAEASLAAHGQRVTVDYTLS